MLMKKKFEYVESYFSVRKSSFKKRLFRWLTKGSSNLFLRTKDAISLNLLALGVHEPGLTKLIGYYADSGYSDFFIDIGANIGITSCQNGEAFKSVYMFEPNPYCFKILEVNTAMALDMNKCYLFNYGLGVKDHKSKLMVPKFNWGGGFIRDSLNSYGDKLLASKDGLDFIDERNYLSVEIEIKKGATVLGRIFNDLQSTNNVQGVVKIDVEGYEPVIIKELAKVLPKNIKLKIIFESFDPSLDIKELSRSFDRNVNVKRLVKRLPWKDGAPGIVRGFCFKSIITDLSELTSDGACGDLVLELD